MAIRLAAPPALTLSPFMLPTIPRCRIPPDIRHTHGTRPRQESNLRHEV